MTVPEIFEGEGISGLSSASSTEKQQARLRNILAEMAALYHVLSKAPGAQRLTVVHDYQGVAAWIEGRWKAEDPVVASVVEACKRLIAERKLVISFRYQESHQKTHVARDDFAFFNNVADRLATEAATKH